MKLKRFNLDELVHADWLARTVQNTKAKLNNENTLIVPSETTLEWQTLCSVLHAPFDRYLRTDKWIMLRLGGSGLPSQLVRAITRAVITANGVEFRFSHFLAIHKSQDHSFVWSGGATAGTQWQVNEDSLVYRPPDSWTESSSSTRYNDIAIEVTFYAREKK
jgi:hypothetical protein